MTNSKLFSYVGFAIKKGSVQYGVDNIISAKRPPKIVLYTEKLSERSQNRIARYAEENKIPLFRYDVEEVLPGRKCFALGVTDEHLANAIQTAIKEI